MSGVPPLADRGAMTSSLLSWAPIRGTALTAVALTATVGLVAGVPAGAPLGWGADRGSALGEADGRIGDREVTAFDTDVAGVARLDPQLRAALQDATRAAADDGVELLVNSGWRSRAYQQHLLDDAVSEYGSYAEARHWVNTPEESTHVTGDAVDVGRPDGADWLDEHGASWGLCRVYANEAWHFELLTSPGGRCPALQGSAH
jgi:zinc D-Ala-D-Ala carboxypeptidase